MGDAAGWQLQPVVSWLMREGRLISDPAQLTEALCLRLADAGAPLWRVLIAFDTIHPQVLAWGATWVRGAASVVFRQAGHEILESDDYLGSPIHAVEQTGGMVRRRLERLDPEPKPRQGRHRHACS